MIHSNKRCIVLDTETTGINNLSRSNENHRIIEIGAVEIIDRKITDKKFHEYINPCRSVDPEAFSIHGISNKFLNNKPFFYKIADKFINFIKGSNLIIHNANFDIKFINYELSILNKNFLQIENICNIIDTLKLARKLFPNKRNSLNALCDHYFLDKSKRKLHSALTDAEILADIYLLMTGGQISMNLSIKKKKKKHNKYNLISFKNQKKKIIYPSKQEIIEHEYILDILKKKSGTCLWRKNN